MNEVQRINDIRGMIYAIASRPNDTNKFLAYSSSKRARRRKAENQQKALKSDHRLALQFNGDVYVVMLLLAYFISVSQDWGATLRRWWLETTILGCTQWNATIVAKEDFQFNLSPLLKSLGVMEISSLCTAQPVESLQRIMIFVFTMFDDNDLCLWQAQATVVRTRARSSRKSWSYSCRTWNACATLSVFSKLGGHTVQVYALIALGEILVPF